MKALAAIAILLGLAAVACAFTQLDDVACPDGGTTLTYQNFGAQLFQTWCNKCHASDAEYRHGAPDEVRFDTLAEIHKWKSRIFERAAADNDSMPPGPAGPSREERDKLAVWLACGAP